jgi:hypothetical protein
MSLFLDTPGFPSCNGRQNFGIYIKGYLKQKVAYAIAQFIMTIKSGASVALKGGGRKKIMITYLADSCRIRDQVSVLPLRNTI